MLARWAHMQESQKLGPLGFDPVAVFGTSLKVWFDVQDLSTMWQDASATVPAAVGSRVAKQFCKVNPSFYRQQATTAQQPFLRQAANGAYYLECDGSDDGMVTPSLDLSAYNKVAVFTAARKLSDAAFAVLLESSVKSDTNDGAFGLYFPTSVGTGLNALYARGTTATGAFVTLAAPSTQIITSIGDIAAPSEILRINKVQDSRTASLGTGNFGNYPLYYFRRAGTSFPFTGYEYGCMIYASATAVPSTPQIAWAEKYLNSFVGAY